MLAVQVSERPFARFCLLRALSAVRAVLAEGKALHGVRGQQRKPGAEDTASVNTVRAVRVVPG